MFQKGLQANGRYGEEEVGKRRPGNKGGISFPGLVVTPQEEDEVTVSLITLRLK